MRIVLAEEMRQLDRQAEETYGLPGLLLMENAGRAVADAAVEMLGGSAAGKRVVILAGKGNNGGDGSGAGRWLVNRGAAVTLVLTGEPEDLVGSAADELQFYLSAGGRLLCWHPGQPDPAQEGTVGTAGTTAGLQDAARHFADTDEETRTLREELERADVIIDALLGTGFSGRLRWPYLVLCTLANDAAAPVLAVDIPTGVHADDGSCASGAMQATRTVTMALPKQGLFLYPGASHVGTLTVADIGMPAPMLAPAEEARFVPGAADIAALLPRRPKTMHKGRAGRVTLVAGSTGYLGAAALAGQAAVKGGAGLVTLLTPASARPLLAIKLTEVMVKGLPERTAVPAGTNGNTKGFPVPLGLGPEAAATVLEESSGADVLAIGPGLGTSEETKETVRQILLETALPCVIDADALTALQDHTDLLLHMAADKVLTPHPGEMSRLTGLTVCQIERNRVETARTYARQWQCVLLLKGVPTVIALPDGTVYLNTTGNPAMATGGCGDVLTGLVAALLAQGLPAGDAAVAAAYLHGLAGDLAADGSVGLAASELTECLPEARKQVAQAAVL
ncbi:MAG: NAD(P)H-hydrate dehydratase [Succiniclasticum sp.]|jgi:ADP-dependent NAD(P)H-hydrate dehydratase / NAD(P)H-hydrate epimerase